MAVADGKYELKQILEKAGATVEDSNRGISYLLVDNKYEISSMNGYYFLKGAKKSMDRGINDFIKMIAREHE